MHSIINFLDPKNALALRDWVALCSLLFTIFSFFTAQYLSARSQRVTRQLAVRPYFSISRGKYNVQLSTDEEGIGTGKTIVTETYKEFWNAKKQDRPIDGKVVDKLYYLIIKNLGPSYALDCKFQIKCQEAIGNETWDISGAMPIFNKDEYIYIPLAHSKYYEHPQTIKELKITFKTQSKESLLLRQFLNKDSDMKMVIYKKVCWELFNKKIIEFPKINGQFRNID